jgi:hypothetical protein
LQRGEFCQRRSLSWVVEQSSGCKLLNFAKAQTIEASTR